MIVACYFLSLTPIAAQSDTLTVLAYNVLYLGDTPPCQGPHDVYEGYLENILAYTNADIVGLEKMAAIPMYSGDHSGTAPAGFADSLLLHAFNAAYPGRYSYCTYTNTSGANNMSILFYNTAKLGFVSIVASYQNITDFNTYKLYYKTPSLATTHDTVFLYVTLNHTNSGSATSDASIRASQIAGEMAQIEAVFTGELPNMLNMGDFNTHNSTEACYQTLVAPVNSNDKYYDPPFYPDAALSYPIDWDSNPAAAAKFLTVSTRSSSTVPNSCSSSGGGKSWYDHIFISKQIAENTNHISYIPNSFTVLGNDGNRVGISVNDAPTNSSAPSAVINDMFQMSEHYPTMLKLEVTPPTGVTNIVPDAPHITITNPIGNTIIMHLYGLDGKELNISCFDMMGRSVFQTTIPNATNTISLPNTLLLGIYYLKCTTDEGVFNNVIMKK